MTDKDREVIEHAEKRLAACPFCGNNAYIQYDMHSDYKWYVACCKCRLRTSGIQLRIGNAHEYIDLLVSSWNNRTDQAKDGGQA